MTTPVNFPPEPYVPFAPYQNTARGLYNSVAQVSRLSETLEPDGTLSMTWGVIPDIIDPFVQIPGQMRCRIAVGFVRRGVDQPMPIVAGRAPDRVGVLYFDLVADPVTNLPLVRSGDRVTMIGGSVFGNWEIRVNPDVAQDLLGAHHVEVQVVEVAQNIQPTSPQPFPGAGSP
jgi:hypothetical protein